MSNTEPHVTVDVIILDARRDAVLLCGDTAPRLPQVTFPGKFAPMDHRFPDRVAEVTGLRTVMLEPLDFTTVVCELLDDPGAGRDGFRWAAREPRLQLGEFYTGWLTRPDRDRPAWFAPGWFARACDYIDEMTAARGAVRVGPVRQVKHWSMSCVLRADTDAGTVYLKAVLPHLAHEPAVIEFLARRWPAAVPAVLARSVADHWWLAADFGGRTGAELPAGERKGCLDRLVTMQAALAGEVDDLAAIGCRPLTGEALARQIPPVLARADLWAAPATPRNLHRGLRADEWERLRALEPFLLDCTGQLADLPLPTSLTHGDFHAGNTVLRTDGFLIYDWSFAAVGNPLLDLASWLHEADEAAAASYVDTYLTCWGGLATPAEVERSWRTVKPLAAVVELLKFAALVDVVGPDYDFNWLPMTYGWARRLLNAAADAEARTAGWRK